MPKGTRMTINVPMLFRLRAEGKSREEICKALGIRLGSWWAVCQRYRVPAPSQPARRVVESDYCPTAEEIQRAAAEVRASWTPAEERKRRVGWRGKPVRLQQFAYDGRIGAFSGMHY